MNCPLPYLYRSIAEEQSQIEGLVRRFSVVRFDFEFRLVGEFDGETTFDRIVDDGSVDG
jgi:hypothetical protein